MGAMVPVVRVKDGVQFRCIAPAGFRILAALDATTKVLGFDLWITSGTDSHTAGKHPLGEAYDVSVKDLTGPVLLKTKAFLEQTLGKRFTVLYECPSPPSDPALAAIAWINPEATGAHLHIQLSKLHPDYPPKELVANV